MIYRTDYHIHTTYGDGKAAPEEYIEPAIAAGLKEIGFSEHFALFHGREEWSMDPVTGVEKYLKHIADLRDSRDDIKVKIGFEVDFYEKKSYKQLFETYFEMIIAAVASELFDIIAHAQRSVSLPTCFIQSHYHTYQKNGIRACDMMSQLVLSVLS